MGIAQLDRAFFYDRTSLRQNASLSSQHTNSRCKLLKTFALIWKYLLICNVFCYSSVCGGKSLRSVSEADLPSSSACTGHNCLQLEMFFEKYLFESYKNQNNYICPPALPAGTEHNCLQPKPMFGG